MKNLELILLIFVCLIAVLTPLIIYFSEKDNK